MKATLIASLLLVSPFASATTRVCGDVIIDMESAHRIVTTDPKSGEKRTLLLELNNSEAIDLIRRVQGYNDKFSSVVICIDGDLDKDQIILSSKGDSIDFQLVPAAKR